MTEHHSFLVVQQSLKQKPRQKKQRAAAKEALIDCLLVLAESADIPVSYTHLTLPTIYSV